MRTLIFILLLFPIATFSQKQDIFIKLTDARAQQIKGDALVKGFERWLQAATISSSGKNNSQLNFTMNISGASADLKRALSNGELLLNGQVTVTTSDASSGRPVTAYTIKMENISVLACSETMGCNNQMTTSVTLKAIRIGWTYYQTDKTGLAAVSRKYGWDEDTQAEWSAF
ncbi:type VI secretion system tube protein Hcp [Terrimonas pollutisoli]|uniref:type VI secretion system tube protein Hcp n=1 Tax=Terrimonas pollutisoli TaxID=3034147 RepID=UPI0023EAB766|nr:type VI secretion system tube protein Hcp [Terrimonas sp. H1YJ31]